MTTIKKVLEKQHAEAKARNRAQVAKVIPLYPQHEEATKVTKGKNKNYAKKNNSPVFSPAQCEQHEMAWIMYIHSGHYANIEHAKMVNAFTMTKKNLAMLARHQKAIAQMIEEVREAMKPD